MQMANQEGLVCKRLWLLRKQAMPYLVWKYNDFGYRELLLQQAHLLVVTTMLLYTLVRMSEWWQDESRESIREIWRPRGELKLAKGQITMTTKLLWRWQFEPYELVAYGIFTFYVSTVTSPRLVCHVRNCSLNNANTWRLGYRNANSLSFPPY